MGVQEVIWKVARAGQATACVVRAEVALEVADSGG